MEITVLDSTLSIIKGEADLTSPFLFVLSLEEHNEADRSLRTIERAEKDEMRGARRRTTETVLVCTARE